jgi:hypothetical protein
VVILERVMPRRLAVSLLCTAFVLAGVVAGPCTGNAACALASAMQMDCCKGPPSGISAPRCCAGARQIGGATAPATAERPAHSRLIAPTMTVAALVAAIDAPARVHAAHSIASRAAPPGGTLVAQHTSLLL